LAFVSSETLSAEERLEIDNRGTLYDDTIHGIRNFTSRNWSRSNPLRLWVWDASSRKAERIGMDLSAIANFQRLVWSPNGRKIAVEYSPPGGPEMSINVSHIGIIDLEKSTFQAVATWSGANRGSDWSADSQSLAFASMGDIQLPRAALCGCRFCRPAHELPV
jgi:Tol biopolymer transport system component